MRDFHDEVTKTIREFNWKDAGTSTSDKWKELRARLEKLETQDNSNGKPVNESLSTSVRSTITEIEQICENLTSLLQYLCDESELQIPKLKPLELGFIADTSKDGSSIAMNPRKIKPTVVIIDPILVLDLEGSE